MVSSNASASIFGWHFQINVAIYFFIKYIADVESIRVEGETEDIELFLKSGEKVYIQSKAYSSLGTNSHALDNLRKSMRTLSNASIQVDCQKLYFITNYTNMIAGRQNQYDIFQREGYVQYSYTELQDPFKKTISTNIELNDDQKQTMIDKLIVSRLPFSGDDWNTRHIVIKKYIDEYLQKLNLNGAIAVELLKNWQEVSFFNASQKSSKTLSKKDLLWPVVIFCCENNIPDEFENMLIGRWDIEEECIDTVRNYYTEYINRKSESFQTITKIIDDYKTFRILNRDLNGTTIKTTDFIDQKWEDYVSMFSVINDIDLAKCLTLTVLYKILNKKNKILSIISEVN